MISDTPTRQNCLPEIITDVIDRNGRFRAEELFTDEKKKTTYHSETNKFCSPRSEFQIYLFFYLLIDNNCLKPTYVITTVTPKYRIF